MRNTHLTVAAVIERDGRFLMVEESIDGTSVLNQPAGHWEDGETAVEAMCRETLEESAWQVEPTALLGLYGYRPPALGYDFLRIAFIAQAIRHQADRKLDAGIERAVWLDASQVRAAHERHRSPMVQRCVDDYLQGRRFPLDLLAELAP